MAYILYFARRVDLQSADMHDHSWNSRLMPGAKNRTLGSSVLAASEQKWQNAQCLSDESNLFLSSSESG